MRVLLSLANVGWVAGLLHGEGLAWQGARASGRISLPHFWPQARGQPGAYGNTGYAGPLRMNGTLAWKWSHPGGQGTHVIGGPLIDGSFSLYVAAVDGVRKFSRDGRLLWTHQSTTPLSGCPSLMGDRLYGNDENGQVFALNLETGDPVWSKRFASSVGRDAACVQSHNGIVVTGVESTSDGSGNTRMLGINGSTGDLIWSHNLSTPVRNVMALFEDTKGASTTLFMDVHGGVHRRRLEDGRVVWYNPAAGSEHSYSEGGLTLGRDGSTYACSNPGLSTGLEGQKGILRKYDHHKGALLWEARLPYPCNSWPAVSEDNKYVVVASGPVSENLASMMARPPVAGRPQAAAFQAGASAAGPRLGGRRHYGLPDLHGRVLALDAQSGRTVWHYEAQPYRKLLPAGIETARPRCAPPHWGAPTLAKHGHQSHSVYIGRADGYLYALDPLHPDTQEEKFYTGMAATYPGAAFGPGMMAYTDCDALHVWDVAETAREQVTFEKEENRVKKASHTHR